MHYSLTVCLHCTEDDGRILVMPFGAPSYKDAVLQMRAWWNGHRDGTGHTWAWRNRDGEEPERAEAQRQAREYMLANLAWAPARRVRH